MTDDERTMLHFNANARPCRHKRKPSLQWDGCWFITCGDGCKCAMSDGDHTSPTPIVTRWELQQR